MPSIYESLIPAVLLFHYFVDDCPLCTPMASTEAVAANRYDHSFLSGTVLHALRVYFIYIADLIRLEF